MQLRSVEDQRHSSPGIASLAHDADLENLKLDRTGNRNTNCVNFQVGEFGSPSTIFYDPCGGEEISPNRCICSIESSTLDRDRVQGRTGQDSTACDIWMKERLGRLKASKCKSPNLDLREVTV